MPTIENARAWYPIDDPVHGFDHMLRVYRLAERLARAEGADLEIVRAAALLHDAQIAIEESSEADEGLTSEARRGAHQHHSAGLAGKMLEAEGWPAQKIAAVQHCIGAHRFRDASTQPETLEAKVLFDADKLDAIGAVGVARAIAYALRAGQPFYAAPSEGFLESGRLEAGEPHSAYHEYVFKLVKIRDRLFTRTARQLAEVRQRRMVEFFEGLAAEMAGIDDPASLEGPNGDDDPA
jgi:uncharacterized protein